MKKKYMTGTSRGAPPAVFKLRRDPTPDPGPCACPLAGFCARYGRVMENRPHEICRGEVLTADQCADYRRRWASKRPKS